MPEKLKSELIKFEGEEKELYRILGKNNIDKENILLKDYNEKSLNESDNSIDNEKNDLIDNKNNKTENNAKSNNK